MDAHYPYVPPAPFRGRFARLEPTSKAVASYNELKNSVNAGRRRVETTQKTVLTAQYDSGIAYVDSQVGILLSRLRELGLYENTLILITSDHGEAFGDHDTIGHTVTSVFQEGSHIPLLVKYPGQHEGSRSDALASHVDILPTVLEAVRAPFPAFLQGQSLRSPRSASEVVFTEARSIGSHEKDARLRGVRRAIVNGNTKLVTWSAGEPELYDLAADPGERVNRYHPDDPLAVSLLARMNAWTATIPRQLAKPAKLDKSTSDRIRSLGYTQ
jgi:arylsulfatase A-like enzyme